MTGALRASDIDPACYDVTSREGFSPQSNELNLRETDGATGVVVGALCGAVAGMLMVLAIGFFGNYIGSSWPLGMALLTGALAGGAFGALGGGLGGLTTPSKSWRRLARSAKRQEAPLEVTIWCSSDEVVGKVEQILSRYDAAHVEKRVVSAEPIESQPRASEDRYSQPPAP